MARIRSIKPEFWAIEAVGRVSRDARILFLGLQNFADDESRFRASPRLLAGQIFPYDDDAAGLMPGWLGELEEAGCIELYRVGADTFGWIPGWSDHQRIDKPSKSKLPEPVTPQEKLFARIREPSSEDSRGTPTPPAKNSSGREGKGRESKGKEGKGEATAASPPVPGWTEAQERLVAAFQQAKGVAYVWKGAADATALKGLLTSGTVDDIEARWRWGLSLGAKWPGVATVSQLASRWNDLASAPVVQGRRAEDKKQQVACQVCGETEGYVTALDGWALCAKHYSACFDAGVGAADVSQWIAQQRAECAA